MPTIIERLQHGWNAFINNKDPTVAYSSYGTAYRPDRSRYNGSAKRTIVTAIKNRIAVDCAAIPLRHVYVDDNDQYVSTIYSSLNDCLNVAANDDQTGTELIQDIVYSMLDEGYIAIVPTDTNVNPRTQSFDILKLRVGKILEWFPDAIRVQLYNEKSGRKEDIVIPKRITAIVTNPFYQVMNSPNSTLQRLDSKLNLLDITDNQIGSGKMNLIMQLPYALKSESKKKEAEKRRIELESQLAASQYGVGYIDTTEKLTQLNRSVENNFLDQVKFLTDEAYAELSMSKAIMDGTAGDQEMLNYYNRTINPILTAIVDSMKWKFLTKTARTRKQSIKYFRDPFELLPVDKVADSADKFTRNAILSSNEVRGIIGFRPSDDPNADTLSNKNMPIQDQMANPDAMPPEETSTDEQPMEQPQQPTDMSQIPISAIMG